MMQNLVLFHNWNNSRWSLTWEFSCWSWHTPWGDPSIKRSAPINPTRTSTRLSSCSVMLSTWESWEWTLQKILFFKVYLCVRYINTCILWKTADEEKTKKINWKCLHGGWPFQMAKPILLVVQYPIPASFYNTTGKLNFKCKGICAKQETKLRL